VLDSRDVPAGIAAYADWAAAAAAGLPCAQAVTAPLTAGPRVIGFVTLHFGLYASRAHNWAPLTEFVDCLGGALFVARAFAIHRDAGGPGPAPRLQQPRTAAVAAGVAPPGSRASEDESPYPASEADAAALAELDAAAPGDAAALRAWSLDAWSLSDEELQRLLLAMLNSAGLLRRFSISPTAAAAFVADVAAHMNDNPFHCFRCVLHLSRLQKKTVIISQCMSSSAISVACAQIWWWC
jgi:hypothetical protein